MRRLFLLACLIFVFQTAAAQPAGNEPKASIADDTLSVDGITPGADVLFYGVGLEATGYVSRTVRWSVVQADSDHDGKVVYKPEKGIPFRSIWVVADLRNAHYVVVTPPGYGALQTKLTPAAFRRGTGGALDTFTLRTPSLDMAYIHPGGGAWTWRVRDGYPGDRNPERGAAGISLEDVRPAGDAGDRPRAFAPGGILVAIDVYNMSVAAVRLDGALLGGGGK